ncbi:MAG: ATP-binding protein, partial [Bacteroidota bacterium]
YFGCNYGLIDFYPENLIANRQAPEIILTDFQLFYESVPFLPDGNVLQAPIWETESISLNHDQNLLSFGFAATNYLRPQLNRFYYQMVGYDGDWISVGNKRTATYTNLDPGDYVFRVKAVNNEGMSSQKPAELRITIQPPFYQTIWFYILAISVVLLGFIAFVRFRTIGLRRRQQELERLVEVRTAEVRKQKDALENTLDELKSTQTQLVESEKMASLGQLTAGVAHEINNPINFVSGNIQPLRQDIADLKAIIAKYLDIIREKGLEKEFEAAENLREELDYDYLLDEIEKLMDGIGEGAQRTATIVKSLRNFSRLDENDRKLTDIHEGIESTLLILRNNYKEEVQVECAYGQLPQIMVYPGKLNQVFMNILTNAIQAIQGPNGDGQGVIKIRTWLAEDKVHLSFKDTGPGMPEDVRKRIFEPFFTTKAVGDGTGLGLSITFGIVEKHGGTIQVESAPGEGTEFLIALPADFKD